MGYPSVRNKFIADNKDGYGLAVEAAYHHSVVEFDKRSAADLTFVVNGDKCKGDRKHLTGVSPVFNAMLYGQFAEAQQDKIVLGGIDSAEIFQDFLLVLSPLRIQPNPSNVVALLKLAHQYDIPFLTRNSEDHLMFCYDLSDVLLPIAFFWPGNTV